LVNFSIGDLSFKKFESILIEYSKLSAKMWRDKCCYSIEEKERKIAVREIDR